MAAGYAFSMPLGSRSVIRGARPKDGTPRQGPLSVICNRVTVVPFTHPYISKNIIFKFKTRLHGYTFQEAFLLGLFTRFSWGAVSDGSSDTLRRSPIYALWDSAPFFRTDLDEKPWPVIQRPNNHFGAASTPFFSHQHAYMACRDWQDTVTRSGGSCRSLAVIVSVSRNSDRESSFLFRIYW
jgi:hypothetical protein